MKKLLLVLSLALFSVSAVLGQRTVTGKVTDQNNEPLIGASVLVKGTTSGTVTEVDGTYSVRVPEDGVVIVFSYTGFETVEVTLGASNVVDVVMQEGVQLNFVTVTALGIVKDRDKTPTASSQVDGGNVVRSGETGVIQGLSGKAAGLQITKTTGDPGAGAFIQIRGQSTITGNLQPLIVVDGMPVFNSSIQTEDAVQGVVEQSRLNDLNPDDIESVEVLKGAAAAALWGTRAANGVIMITTKKGKYTPQGKGFNIDFRSTYSSDQISISHPLQRTWGQGDNGIWIANTGNTWGDKIADRPGGANQAATEPGQYFTASGADMYQGYFLAEDGTKIYQPLAANTNVFNSNGDLLFRTGRNGGVNDNTDYIDENFDQIFRSGWFIDNSLSISGADEKSSFYASVADLRQKGIIQGNSDYNRTTFRINADRRFASFLKASVNASYSRVTSNRIQQGSNLNGLYLGYLRTSADYDNTTYRGVYYNAAGLPSSTISFDADGNPLNWNHRGYRRYLGNGAPTYNNPGWTIYDQTNTSAVNRFLVGSELTLTLTDWLSVVGRAGVDVYDDQRITDFPVNSATWVNGYLLRTLLNEKQFNSDVFLRAGKVFSSNFSLEAILGMNFNERTFGSATGQIQNFTLPFYKYSLENAVGSASATGDFESLVRTQAAYASVDLGLMQMLYINLTGRYEGASTFGADANPFFFYPSASAAWVFSNLDALKGGSALSFGRLRASYGSVGVQPGPYLTLTDYIPGGILDGWGPALDPSDYGAGTFISSNIQGNSELAPERKTETELGLDLRFLKDRIGLSYTFFTNKTVDAILPVDVPGSTGFTSKWANAATIENTGHEIELDADIIRKGDFRWNLYGNFTRNRNEVTDLSGVQSIFLNGFTGASSRAVEGQPLGVLWGGLWDRDESGNLILDETGFPSVAAEEGVIGDPNPDFRAGLGTVLSYKGFTLSALFETSQGQDMWGGTLGVLYNFGVHEDTDVETTVSAADAANIYSYFGASVADMVTFRPDYYRANPDGSITFRGSLEDFGGGTVALDRWWYTSLGGGFGPVAEQFIYDASWTRLRELTLSYRLDSKGFRNSTKLSYIELGLTGRNLFIWTPFVGVDPELNLTGVSNGRGLDYFTNPGTRSYLVSLKIGY